MDRRSFLLAAAAAPVALRRPRPALAYVTADLESHVAVVDLERGAVVRRIPTRPGPRVHGRIRPGFLAHDVGWAPDGRLWVTGGEAAQIGVYARTMRVLPAGSAPQHVTFLGNRVFVTSGEDGTVRIHGGRTVDVPVGSYN